MTSPNDEASPRSLPMFPLGSVLVPSMLLPLHIFEPRYRALIRDVLDADGEFGVVMIERGSEVGGDDVRAGVGCVARVLEAEEQPDGRWIVMAVGTAVVDVQAWSVDDPYPRAVVVERDGPAADGKGSDGSSFGDDPRWLELDTRFREVLAAAAALDASPIAPTITLSDDPWTSTYQMAAVAPVAVLDRYRVLCAPSAELRRTILLESFDDVMAILGEAP